MEPPENHPLILSLQQIGQNLRSFIELSLHATDASWKEWKSSGAIKDLDVKCWERKKCDQNTCNAYLNSCGRCWLIAGTMCGSEPFAECASEYNSCTECEVYREIVFKDPVAEIYEHLITLVHSLRLKNDELKTMATRDLLTGLYNRNYFDLVIVKEIARVSRYGGQLSLIIIDVDNFKKINDKYGHLHGDWVLRECAGILSRAVRDSDVLVRFGGDEFLIAMPETDCNQRESFLNRLKKDISSWNEKHKGYEYELSLSVGCAMWEKGKDLSKLINEADTLMYRDKALKQ